MPKSKLSRRLALLEHQLGSQLLARTTRRQQLTEQGLLLLQTCKPHIEALYDIDTFIGASASTVKGKLKLLLPQEFFNTVISSLITDFAAKYPELEIHCHQYDKAYPEFDHQYDLVFVLHENELPNSNWIGRTLLSFSQSIYTSANREKAKDLPTITNQPVIAATEREQWLFRSASGIETISPNITMVLSSPEMRVEACKRSIGLTKLPDYIGKNNREIRAIPTAHTLIAQQLTLLYQSRKLPAKTRMFLDYFQSNIGCFS